MSETKHICRNDLRKNRNGFCPPTLPLNCPCLARLYQISFLDGWTTDDLKYQWKKDDPVQITKDLHLPRFTLEKYVSDYCNIKTNTGELPPPPFSLLLTSYLSFSGEYSCLTVDLTFKREFSYYLLTIYVPCCMLVIVSWVSFWLDSRSVPARVALGVTTLLTMSTQTAGVNRSLPPVAYTKVFCHQGPPVCRVRKTGSCQLSNCARSTLSN